MVMKTYKITYWCCGNLNVAYVKAETPFKARLKCELTTENDGIANFEEVTE